MKSSATAASTLNPHEPLPAIAAETESSANTMAMTAARCSEFMPRGYAAVPLAA